ncbi:MAG TPA: ABC transporter substrate-binding protein [Acidimicrobiales bacterium]|nr:ABC transporter substrate-binding protein [Acidimicrobiales bacterium]
MIKSKWNRIRMVAVLCTALSTLAIGATVAATSTTVAGASSKPYVLGVSAGVTGAAAAIVAGELQGAQAYLNSVNASGGVNGHKIKLVTLDTQNVVATAAATFTQLVTQDKASAVIGDVLSGNCDAQLTVATRYKVPVVCGTLDPTELKPVHKYGFTEYGAEAAEANAIISIISKAPLSIAAPKIALIYIATPSDTPLFNAVASAAASINGTVVYNDPIGAQLDLTTDAAKAVASGANVIVEQIIPQQLQSLDTALQNDGSSIPIVAEASTASYQEMGLLKDPTLYQMSLAPFVNASSPQPAVKAYVKALKHDGITGQSNINAQSVALTYVTTEAIVKAMKNCGKNCTPAQIATALGKVKINQPGLNTDFSFTPKRHYPQTTFSLFGYSSSKGVHLISSHIAGNGI